MIGEILICFGVLVLAHMLMDWAYDSEPGLERHVLRATAFGFAMIVGSRLG